MTRLVTDILWLAITAALICWAAMAIIQAASAPRPAVCASYAPSDCAAAAEIAGEW